jgi:hypothetical protein
VGGGGGREDLLLEEWVVGEGERTYFWKSGWWGRERGFTFGGVSGGGRDDLLLEEGVGGRQ